MKRRSLLIAIPAATALGWVGWRWLFRPTEAPQLEIPPLTGLGARQYDICIIGSGPAGCTVAAMLAEQGKSVLLVESGADARAPTSVQISEALDKYSTAGSLEYSIADTRVRALGGTSLVWTGRTPRMLPADFTDNPMAPGRSWPVSYDELQPHYRAAERWLNVVGDPLTAGHAPRLADFAERSGKDIRILRDFLSRAGIAVDYPPASKSFTLDGKPMRYGSDYVPGLWARSNVTVVPEATVTRLHQEHTGTVESMTLRRLGREEVQVRAKQFVLAAGGVESVRLLMLSNRTGTTREVGAMGDHLGRYFMEHPWYVYYFSLDPSLTFPFTQLGRTHVFHSYFREDGLGSIMVSFYGLKSRPGQLKVAVNCEMAPDPANRIELDNDNIDAFGDPGAKISLGFSPLDQALHARVDEFVQDLGARLGATAIEKEEGVTWSAHHMGATRMSLDPAGGVVDANLRVHGTNNLYIASSSVFVTSGNANPTLTIVALANRLGEHLAAHA